MKKIIFIVMVIPQMLIAKNISIHGHRGARAARPENTMAAFKYALEVGVDVLEFDLSVTKDNVLVISHDPYINPTICQHQNGQELKAKTIIRDLTLKQVQMFDCGSIRNPRFPKQILSPGEKIPTLDELFLYISKNNKKVEFNIETKIIPGQPELTVSPEKFSQLLIKIIKIIKKFKMEKRTIVQSFDYRTLKWIKKLYPQVRTSQLIYGGMVDLVAAAKAINADIVSPHYSWINKDEVQRLQNNGIQVAPWTANDKQVWDKLIKMGVDAIITDDPAVLKKYLNY
ncbi:MAG: glycerophosphodiester phosphodiesterase [Bdellovibrionaceae bacterium]|jgi:glycerophosphoryl diester phosphodiesterase|nr:glycerophosphodiester phosphodiesterase [Pseudobdellovibrionaceae bacterium]